MLKSLRPETTIFLACLLLTVFIWVLRGLGILTFVPGSLIWFLILATVGTAIVNGLLSTRR
ncbi:hypothetical protein [Leptolyngbya sp. FACHB-711]|uniref:hypothetical protein n=1 Tax=unclassified Leptolyngbya TaxID=2650499 RepID=UPI001683011F|nr:hypothetical protein [Leptolyngbya sp. FACHB-711]MBD1850416.1 hypothetical protein [Cyanobacteria bacterium FACHB-502]MBD2026079.1 hypothetical protein [Leptolyngbya sp. FACHB-711]